MSQTSSSETKSEAPTWLQEKVYTPRKERTYDLVVQAIDALLQEKQRISLASVAIRSRQIDPKGVGVAESTILNNEQARVYYMEHRTWNKGASQPKGKKEKSIRKVGLQIKQNRDLARAHRRYMRMGKAELVDRLMATEQAYADQEELWLQLNDELLIWKLRAQAAEERLTKHL